MKSEMAPYSNKVVTIIIIIIKIYHAFKRRKEVKVVYLDKSKAFDRVWHRELLVKLER